jgi:hypothetical protein
MGYTYTRVHSCILMARSSLEAKAKDYLVHRWGRAREHVSTFKLVSHA